MRRNCKLVFNTASMTVYQNIAEGLKLFVAVNVHCSLKLFPSCSGNSILGIKFYRATDNIENSMFLELIKGFPHASFFTFENRIDDGIPFFSGFFNLSLCDVVVINFASFIRLDVFTYRVRNVINIEKIVFAFFIDIRFCSLFNLHSRGFFHLLDDVSHWSEICENCRFQFFTLAFYRVFGKFLLCKAYFHFFQ